MKAILYISHGSRSPLSGEENRRMASILKEKSGFSVVEYAFLEVAQPDIFAGIKACVDKGAREIVVLLNFLNSGNHVLKDIPGIFEEARKKYPEVIFKIPPHLGAHPAIPDLFLDLIERAEDHHPESGHL